MESREVSSFYRNIIRRKLSQAPPRSRRAAVDSPRSNRSFVSHRDDPLESSFAPSINLPDPSLLLRFPAQTFSGETRPELAGKDGTFSFHRTRDDLGGKRQGASPARLNISFDPAADSPRTQAGGRRRRRISEARRGVDMKQRRVSREVLPRNSDEETSRNHYIVDCSLTLAAPKLQRYRGPCPSSARRNPDLAPSSGRDPMATLPSQPRISHVRLKKDRLVSFGSGEAFAAQQDECAARIAAARLCPLAQVPDGLKPALFFGIRAEPDAAGSDRDRGTPAFLGDTVEICGGDGNSKKDSETGWDKQEHKAKAGGTKSEKKTQRRRNVLCVSRTMVINEMVGTELRKRMDRVSRIYMRNVQIRGASRIKESLISQKVGLV